MKKLTTSVLIAGTAATHPEIRYVTGFLAPDIALVLSQPRKTVLIVSSMEYGRAIKQATRCMVESPDTLNLPSEKRNRVSEWGLAALAKQGVTTVEVDSHFPLGLARQLEAGGISLTINNDTFLKRARQVKSEEEIRYIARVQRATRTAMKAVGRAITEAVPGRGGILRWNNRILTSEVARDIIRKAVLSLGCIDEGTIVAGGAQAADPHQCGTGSLRTGEWIVCDIFPRHLETGYWGDMTRTFMNGRPKPEQRRLYHAVKTAHDEALATITPGVFGRTVHSVAADHLEAAGYKTYTGDDGLPRGFIHSTGHGVGLEIHEEPRLSLGGGKLLENMVVTVEPGLYYPELGGVRYEDLVVVRATGPQVL